MQRYSFLFILLAALAFVGLANATTPTIPSGIQYYVAVNITNSQTTATPSPFQQMINITESTFSNYIAYNNNFANFEYFYANGTIIPAWIESNSSNKITTWVKLSNTIFPNTGSSSATNTIYLGFASKTTNLLSSSGTSGIGEAPQLSSTYGQYDDGSSVFLNYFAGATSSGWTIAGTAGQTTSAPSGNPTFGTDAFYANGASGDYLYTTASGQSTNMIIEFYGYTANLQDLYFLVNSTGAGQMMRDGNGGRWYGIASTSSWTSWGAPPDTGSWSNEWVTVGVVVNGGIATGYLMPGVNIYGAEIGSNPSNQYTVSNNGDYLGLIGDRANSTTTQYWSGIIIRAYPPNGVMPSVSFGSVQAPSGYPLLTITPNPITYGSNTLVYVNTSTATNTAGNTIELLMNGAVVAGPTTSNIIYTLFNSLQAGYGAGSYTFNAYDENTLNSEIGTLVVNKNSTYPFSLSLSPSQSYIYNGTDIKATYSLTTYKNQLTGTLYLNGNLISSTTTSGTYTSGASPGAYIFTFNTIGNANYTPASITKKIFISPAPSSLPSDIVEYIAIPIYNNQSVATPSPFQQMIQINKNNYTNYMTYNGNFANFEFFYQNGTVIPAWIESNVSNIITTWVKLTPSIPANGMLAIYLGFANKTTNLLSSSGTSGIGEAPQLSSTYAQYDDGASVFIYYNVNPTSTTGWTIAGTAGLTTSAPSGSHYSTTNALYANSARGDYLYTAISDLSTNEIISFNVYTTGLGDLFFLTNSTGSGQMARLDSRSGDPSGLATTSSWTSWSDPTGIQETSNTWYKYDVVISGTSAYAYIGSISDSLATFGTVTSSSSFSVKNKGNYLGLVGDALGSSYITYWNGFIVRAYPPKGVMPSVSFGSVQAAVQITKFIETGLPSGAKWNVTYGGILNSSTTNTIIFSTAPGNYLFNVPAQTVNDVVYEPSPSSGYLIGGNTTAIAFKPFSISISAPSNTVVDVGQYETFTATVYNGTSPYTYNILVVNSITPSVIAHNDLVSGSSNMILTYTFQTTSADVSNSPEEANVVVTDSFPATVNSVYSSTFTINPTPAITLAVTPSNSIMYGSPFTINAVISGGTGNFAVYLYLNGNSIAPTIVSQNTITSNTMMLPAAGNYVYTVDANDIGTSSVYTLTPATNTIIVAQNNTLTASSSGNPGSSYYSYPVTITFTGTPTINHQAKWSLYVNGQLYGTTNSTITYYEEFAPPGTYNFVFNLTSDANYTPYTYKTSLVISYPPTGAHFVSTTVTTVTTTSITTSIPTTIPPSQKAISITSNISSSSPLVINLPNTHSVLSIYTTSTASAPIVANIINVTQQVSSLAKPKPNYTLISAVNLSIITTAPITLFFVEHYPCSIPSDLVVPYIFKNNTWLAIANYTVNATACTVSFNIPSDPIVAIFEKSVPTTTTTSIATTIPTTIPTTIYHPSPKPSNSLVVEALALIIILIIVILVLLYYKLLHRKYHGFYRK